MKWLLREIIAATGGRLLYGREEQSFRNIGIDSRTIESGDLFVAIRGESHDGHAFVSQVIDNVDVKGVVIEARTGTPMDHQRWRSEGRVCIEVEDTIRALGALAAFRRRLLDIPVIAVTGSNGKTTTREMTASVMSRHYKTLSTIGNLNNEIGLPLTLFKLDKTHQAAVLELGINHFGEMDRLGAICKPTMGLITNVGPAHLEFLGSLEGVARAKAELLPHVTSKGHAILNKDDEYTGDLAVKASCPVVYFGTTSQADVRAESIYEDVEGVAFDLILPGDRIPVRLSTPGRFMVYNALAAAAAGHLAGVGAEDVKKGLESFSTVSGRLNVIETARGVKVIDDTYNANPASMAAAIEAFTAMKQSGRGYMVFGDMYELGANAGQLHRNVGVLAGSSSALKIYACGDHAREVMSGAREAGKTDENLLAGTKEEIIADLVDRVRPKDWVLVKGSRAMAMETVVKALCDL